jgi:antitoxin CptB
MSDEEVDAYTRLMDLTDNDLMDLLLARKEPAGEVDLPQVHALMRRLRQA